MSVLIAIFQQRVHLLGDANGLQYCCQVVADKAIEIVSTTSASAIFMILPVTGALREDGGEDDEQASLPVTRCPDKLIPPAGGTRGLLDLQCLADLVELPVHEVGILAVAVVLGQYLLRSFVLVLADEPTGTLWQQVDEEQLDAWHGALQTNRQSPRQI